MKQRLAKRSGWCLAVGIAIVSLLALWDLRAQYGGGRGWRRGYEIRDPEMIRENDMMEKALNPAFKEDVFTFARLRFNADRGWRFGGGRLWDDDAPEADLNTIFRLFETTSLKVRPGLHFIDITTNDLVNYPFVYVAAAARMQLTDEEAGCLRRYLLNGGFIMADDFWGDDQWLRFREQLKMIFPDREPVELALDHPVFRTVFKFKKQPQIPSVGAFMRYGVSYDPGWPYLERNHDPHYYAVYDDKKRMIMLICYNNHYGDGWEHEGDDETYFDTFSEPMAYPMLINVLVYAMSH